MHNSLTFLVKPNVFPLILNVISPLVLVRSLLAYAREQQRDPFGPRVEEFVEELAKALVFDMV